MLYQNIIQRLDTMSQDDQYRALPIIVNDHGPSSSIMSQDDQCNLPIIVDDRGHPSSWPQLSLDKPNTPTLQTAITPFHRSRSGAATAALFYTKCTLERIPPKEADKAALASREAFHGWWRGERFKQPKKDDIIQSSSSSEEAKRMKRGCGSDARSQRRRGSNGKVVPVVSSDEEPDVDASAASTTSLSKQSDEEPPVLPSATTVNVVRGPHPGSNCLDDKSRITSLKSRLVRILHDNNGDVTHKPFLHVLDELSSLYKLTSSRDDTSSLADGTWVDFSRPKFQECLGQNSKGEFTYTLGRMSFDMFQPTNLKCFIQGTLNTIRDIRPHEMKELIRPRTLRRKDLTGLKTYNITVAFTIETPNGSPLKALLTNHGYMLPDPDIPNNFSIWFTHGILEEDTSDHDDNDGDDDIPTSPSPEWKQVFQSTFGKNIQERARVLAARVLLGVTLPSKMNEDGSMDYWLNRPISAGCDVLFMDESLRIIKGHHGSIYVLHRLPEDM